MPVPVSMAVMKVSIAVMTAASRRRLAADLQRRCRPAAGRLADASSTNLIRGGDR
jgi:hypothetical protein